MQQTPRGIPVPSGSDPDAVPGVVTAIASFLDPGTLVAYTGATPPANQRILFLQTGDGDPITLAVTPLLGSMYFDRTRARLWFPLSVSGGLTWVELGADTDTNIAAVQASVQGIVKTGTSVNQQVRSGAVACTLTTLPGGVTSTQAWTAAITFPSPFTTAPVVLADNQDSAAQPNVLVGVQNVTSAGFTVQITRSDLSFGIGNSVTIGYIAVGS